jgi:hypothetical protein
MILQRSFVVDAMSPADYPKDICVHGKEKGWRVVRLQRVGSEVRG